MLARWSDGSLTVRSVDGAQSWTVDVGGLGAVTSLALHPHRPIVALTCGRAPDPTTGARGDLRLVTIDLETGTRRTLSAGYAHDAVWDPTGERLAFSDGRAITVVDLDGGTIAASDRTPRYSWGPPAMSFSPDGARVGFVRWKGDLAKLATLDLARGITRVSKASCYRYAWAGDRILFATSAGLFLLDPESDKRSAWLKTPDVLAKDPATAELLQGAEDGLLGPRLLSPVTFGDRVYLVLHLSKAGVRHHALCSIGLDKARPRACWIAPPNAMIEHHAVIDEGRVIAIDATLFDGLTARRGGMCVLVDAELPEGFTPLPRRPPPEFGFILPRK